MVRRLRAALGGACLSAVIVLASCDTVGVHRLPRPGPGRGVGHGPPAHARAHGYRAKRIHGHELIFDSTRGVYVVVGITDCYYHDGYFYRLRGDVWEISLRTDGDWGPARYTALPPGLQVRAKAKAPATSASHGKARGYARGKKR